MRTSAQTGTEGVVRVCRFNNIVLITVFHFKKWISCLCTKNTIKQINPIFIFFILNTVDVKILSNLSLSSLFFSLAIFFKEFIKPDQRYSNPEVLCNRALVLHKAILF